MRIIFILPEYRCESAGGIRSFYCNLLPALVGAGCRVRVLVAHRDGFDAPSFTDEGGVVVEYLRSDLFEKHSRNVAASYVKSYRTLGHFLPLGLAAYEQARAGEGYDLVELTDWPLFFLPWVCLGAKVPFTISLHSSIGQMWDFERHSGGEAETHFVRLLEAAAFSAAPSVHTNSKLNACYWERITNRKIEVLLPLMAKAKKSLRPMAVDGLKVAGGSKNILCSATGIDLPPLAASYPRLLTPPGVPLLDSRPSSVDTRPPLPGAVFARLQNLKGAEVLCEALRLVPEVSVDWYGRSVPSAGGAGAYAEELMEKFPEVFGKQLLHRGEVTHQEVLTAMGSASFVCVPSLWDVFNLTVIEGMAQGSVVICSKLAGAEMLIEHGRNGFVFDPHDPATLADAMRQCYRLSDDERQRLGRLAIETIKTTFNSEELIRKRIDYYAGISKDFKGLSGDSFLRSLVDFPDAYLCKKRTLRQKLLSRAVAVLKKWE